ncbi:XisI protein [Planktothrix sp. FACHB-1355]|uniref:XisI protein n=1 Tax=Aerosakkonema funiforme FACHB-1375 TaxID=2949571 RepID=A0A926VKR3_9CYAN|nr:MULTISPECIES: XisI protein [Oscillatoriales]MBD2185681.1 XisI protein [Aerosakkonema funiforme FACHB-1375]MBD3561714.1 XisI protein [Planktothrix sp. FACHB-1355]
MEIEKYKELIKSIIEKHSQCDSDDCEVETQIAFDVDRDRYLMFHVGWRGERRVFGCVIHIEIREGKIWIQRDGTEVGIANELIEAGVPKSDIVLGYRSPYMRKFTELAVG